MKLLQILSISLAAVLLLIGAHQTIYYGIANSYFFFAFSLGFVFLYKLLKDRTEPNKTERKEQEKKDKKQKSNQAKVPRQVRRQRKRDKKKDRKGK